MAKTSGRQVEVGIGIEATPGTAVAATYYFKWDSFTMQSMVDKVNLTSARGIRTEISGNIINRRYGKGAMECVPTPYNMPYILGLALGVRTTVTDPDSSEDVYDHTYTIQQLNASMKTATLFVQQGAVQTEKYANVVADTLDLTFAKDLAKAKVGFIGQYPTTGSMTTSYSVETLFSRNNMTAQFGDSLADAADADVTPLVDFSVSIANATLFDDAFLSGSTDIAAGGLVAGPLTIKGSYTLQFADTVELAKYQADTLDAMIATVTGAAIGDSSHEQIIISLSRLILNKAPLEYQIKGLTYLKQEFEVQYDATDGDISVEVINLNAGTNY